MHGEQLLELVKPLTVMPISEFQQALQMMQAGKLTGKIVIEITEDSIVQVLYSFASGGFSKE